MSERNVRNSNDPLNKKALLTVLLTHTFLRSRCSFIANNSAATNLDTWQKKTSRKDLINVLKSKSFFLSKTTMVLHVIAACRIQKVVVLPKMTTMTTTMMMTMAVAASSSQLWPKKHRDVVATRSLFADPRHPRLLDET